MLTCVLCGDELCPVVVSQGYIISLSENCCKVLRFRGVYQSVYACGCDAPPIQLAFNSHGVNRNEQMIHVCAKSDAVKRGRWVNTQTRSQSSSSSSSSSPDKPLFVPHQEQKKLNQKDFSCELRDCFYSLVLPFHQRGVWSTRRRSPDILMLLTTGYTPCEAKHRSVVLLSNLS